MWKGGHDSTWQVAAFHGEVRWEVRWHSPVISQLDHSTHKNDASFGAWEPQHTFSECFWSRYKFILISFYSALMFHELTRFSNTTGNRVPVMLWRYESAAVLPLPEGVGRRQPERPDATRIKQLLCNFSIPGTICTKFGDVWGTAHTDN